MRLSYKEVPSLGEEAAEVAGADREDELVRGELPLAGAQGDVGQRLRVAQVLGRGEEGRVVVVPLEAVVLGGPHGRVTTRSLHKFHTFKDSSANPLPQV